MNISYRGPQGVDLRELSQVPCHSAGAIGESITCIQHTLEIYSTWREIHLIEMSNPHSKKNMAQDGRRVTNLKISQAQIRVVIHVVDDQISTWGLCREQS